MSRQYDPNRRRRKPGRPPPYKYRPRPQPGGYTGNGLNAYWSWLMPELRGKEKKAFFNSVSMGIPFSMACSGAIVGYGAGGVLGAMIGAAVGLAGGCSIAEEGRFFRR